jgi:hypothetical protein
VKPLRYFRTLSVNAPGDVDEQFSEWKDVSPLLKNRLPKEMREQADGDGTRGKVGQ